MCSFVSALLSPEASGQQVLHKREDRAFNCHPNVTYTGDSHAPQSHLRYSRSNQKKSPWVHKKCYTKHHPTSAGFALQTAGAHTAVTIIVLHFTDLEYPAVGSRTNSGPQVGTLRKELCFMKRSFCAFLEGLPQVTNTAKLPKSPINNLYDSYEFLSVLLSLLPLCVHTNAGAQRPWAGLVLRQGRLSPCQNIPRDPKDFCNVTKIFSNLSGHRFSTSYCS